MPMDLHLSQLIQRTDGSIENQAGPALLVMDHGLIYRQMWNMQKSTVHNSMFQNFSH